MGTRILLWLLTAVIVLAAYFLVTRVKFARKVLTYGVFAFFVLMSLLPILWLLYSSFKPLSEILMNQLALPHHWTLQNYAGAWKLGRLGIYFINSIIYTTVTTVAVVVFGLMASYAFAKIPNKWTPFLHSSFIIGILITLQAVLIPLFFMEKSFMLTNTRLGVILPYIGISLPLSIYLGTEFIKAIPDSIIESAKIDGAGPLRIFFSIILPMSAPVAITIAIMTTLSIWNEFMFIFILTTDTVVKSLPIGIYSFSGPQTTEFGMQYAALMIGLLPMMIFYFIFHKRITEGVAAGSVKG